MRLSSSLAVVVLAVGSLHAESHDGSIAPIRLCVPAPQNRTVLDVRPSGQRDRLVTNINHLAQKKKAKVRVEAIPVDGSRLGDAEAGAKQSECRYLVVSTFTPVGLFNPDSIGGTVQGPMAGAPPPIGYDARRIQLEYKVLRVGSTTRVDEGTLQLPQADSTDSAEYDLLRQLALQVVKALLKDKEVSQVNP
jgi:hypothetical protein